MPPILGTSGLLEDAIAAGQQPQQLAQMSSFFQPGQAQQFETAANASLGRGDLPAINPWSGRQWGEESAIYQNQDVAALNARDATRAKMLEAIGRLDPDIQASTMRQWGFAPEQEVGSTNYNGMSPTQALFGGGGQGGMGEIGSKLRQELIKLKYAHELGADERDKADILRNIQAMTALSTAQSNASYRQSLEGARQTTNAQQLLGLLDNFTKQHQIAAQPGPLGNPTDAAALAQAIEFIRSQIGQMGGGTGAGAMQGGGVMTGRAAGNPAAMDLTNPNRTPTYSELNPPVEEQTPWWDRGMPSSRPTQAPTQDIMGQVNYYQKRLEAVKKYDPGNVAAQEQLQRAIQNLLMPQFIQGTQTPGASNEGITVKKK